MSGDRLGANSGQSEAAPAQGDVAQHELARVLIVGVGNQERCDDGVGVIVARALAAKSLRGATIVESSGDGAALSQLWYEADHVILIDAVSSGAQPGTVHRIDASVHPLPTPLFHGSSHTFGVGEAIELSRALNQLPPRLIVYGIEGKNFENGIGLSPEIVNAARRVVASVTRQLRVRRNRITRRRTNQRLAPTLAIQGFPREGVRPG